MIPLGLRLFFRGFWNLIQFRKIVIVAACGLAMWIQLQYRTPSPFLFLLIPSIGAVITLLSVILLIKPLFAKASKEEPGQILNRLEWWGGLLVRIFVYYSLFIYINAKLDRSDPIDHRSEILEISGGTIKLGIPLSYSWASLHSWENSGRVERLLLQDSEEKHLWGGESVIVQVRRGYFKLPWVSKLERDEEKYSREILKLMPTASKAWVDLANFYLDYERWKEASDATHEYLKIYPKAYDFAVDVGGALNVAGYYTEAISLFDYVIANKPTYEVYQLLGWSLSYQGNKKRAAEVLEASIPLNPEDWEAYYHLGYVYTDLARPQEAIAMFEKVLQLQPNFPEVEEQISLNRTALRNRDSLRKRS